MDWDMKALEQFGPLCRKNLAIDLRLLWGNFSLLYKILKKEEFKAVDGILADFGTSQVQIMERPGFSVYRDSALDMRMSPSHQQMTAADVLAKCERRKIKTNFLATRGRTICKANCTGNCRGTQKKTHKNNNATGRYCNKSCSI